MAHGFACLFPNCSAKLGSHWQLVPAVAQGHKSASEWMTINLALDLNQTASTKELHRVRPDYITPTPFWALFCSLAVNTSFIIREKPKSTQKCTIPNKVRHPRGWNALNCRETLGPRMWQSGSHLDGRQTET